MRDFFLMLFFLDVVAGGNLRLLLHSLSFVICNIALLYTGNLMAAR